MTDYKPIACEDYERLELAILKRRHVTLSWRVGNVSHVGLVTPLNLETAQGEEFLEFKTQEGAQLRVRLDYVGLPP